MKVHIVYPFVNGAWGGANQFLKAIKEYLLKCNSYEENVENADVILFNSSPMALVEKIYYIKSLKLKYPRKLFINRIDGPVYLIRDRNIYIDKAFYQFNDLFCDGTLFQSSWSKEKNYLLGMKQNIFETTILNAPNQDIFNTKDRVTFNKNRKIKLIATSWSANMKKGFDTYKWLDDNLNFYKYEMTFIGNSPVKFKNIIHKKPMNSLELVKELKQHDIYITASKIEACSNSLIEAMHCGLVPIAYNGSSNVEIVNKSGELFVSNEDILILLEKIIVDYNIYKSNINLPNINEVGQLYYNFLKNIYNKQNNGSYKSKKFNIIGYLKLKTTLFFWKLTEKIYAFNNRV